MNAILNAKRILIVEDEEMIAMLIEETVLDEGGVVVGPVGDLDGALALARDAAIDAAVLDVNLAGKPSYPVADILAGRGIPFLFATGYGDQSVASAHAAAPVIGKPFQLDAMVAAIEQLLG